MVNRVKSTSSQYDDYLVDQIRTFFLENPISLNDISRKSVELFGRHITEHDMRYLSRTDPKGPWTVQKANLGIKTEDVPIADKIQKVANKLYELIIDEENELPPNQLAQIAKTWADLIDKAKLTREVTTSRVPSQTAKDIFAEIEAEYESNKSN